MPPSSLPAVAFAVLPPQAPLPSPVNCQFDLCRIFPCYFRKDAEDGDDGGDDDGDDESDNLVDRKHLDALATSWSR